jgi:murein DD-endopeptidase MepM/ murein hydrolase activator NlpD
VIISLAAIYGFITNGGFPGRADAFAAPVTGISMPGVSSSVPATGSTVLRAQASNKTLPTEKIVFASFAPADPTVEATAAAAPSPTIVAAPQQDAVVRAASVAPPPDLPPYQVYQVREGDSVSSVASRFGILPDYIIANNADVRGSGMLLLGQSLIVPAGNGMLHEVRYGETLSDIAVRYDVDVQRIVDFRANNIDSPDALIESQLLFVPDGRIEIIEIPAEPEPTDSPAPEATPEPSFEEATEEPATEEPIVEEEPPPPSSGPVSGEGLMWPIVGPISSYMGPGHPLGIDIDGFRLAGAPIAAATSGTVIFAGGNACCSYGLYVVIMSPGGIETLYAHLDSIYVSQGEFVSQGQAIGAMGSSGYSTGTHLHFEVIDNGVRQNPLNYLP